MYGPKEVTPAAGPIETGMVSGSRIRASDE
jgi:hypothetical protein